MDCSKDTDQGHETESLSSTEISRWRFFKNITSYDLTVLVVEWVDHFRALS